MSVSGLQGAAGFSAGLKIHPRSVGTYPADSGSRNIMRTVREFLKWQLSWNFENGLFT